jgi:DNA-directed RNA polymerase specialized sigma24 family protein
MGLMRMVQPAEAGERRDSQPEPETESADRLGDLYARHVPAAIGFAYLLTGNRAEAEDLVQEAFIRVVGRLRHLREADAFDAYLMRTPTSPSPARLYRARRVQALPDGGAARHRRA